MKDPCSSVRHGAAPSQEAAGATTTAGAAADATSTNPRPAKRNLNSPEGKSTDGHDQKRRRRAFSCLSCQKLKCRCEYEPGSFGCHRCQTLRIECSLGAEHGIPSSSNPAPTQHRVSIEERLQRQEDALKDMQAMIAQLRSQRQPDTRSLPTEMNSPYLHGRHGSAIDEQSSGPAYLSRPADRGTGSAPIVVLRELNAQVYKGYRRLLQDINIDLVQLGLIDEIIAKELIELFWHHQGHNLIIVCDVEDLCREDHQRKASAFLHSVCCLLGIVYRKDLCGTPVHRRMYEEVRITLGQALLSSPLALDDINAIFLMSNNANTPNNQGSEYIDSWLLTGYCAKQAMLSICFSKIVDRINRNASTLEDQRAVRLFSLICLHHLQWAATTGRPSIIPAAYTEQCNLLHSFRRATMQDGMLVAETVLYADLHQKLSRHCYLSDSGECDEFMSWRQKWEYLWALPTSSMLKVGYHAACLILALRWVEENGGALRPQTILSDEDADAGTDDGQAWTDSRHTRGGEKDNVMRAHACKYAKLVLETFLQMPPSLMGSVPTCLCLCVGYCALLLAHYDESQSSISDQVSLDIITRVDDWVRHAPGKAWSYKYGDLARRKVEARLSKARRTDGSHQGRSEGISQRVRDCATVQEPPPRLDVSAGNSGTEAHADLGGAGVYHAAEWIPPEHSFDTVAASSGFDQSPFPSLEYYFGGGFYDFTR